LARSSQSHCASTTMITAIPRHGRSDCERFRERFRFCCLFRFRGVY
jgi:hypothetical protein